MVEILTSLAKMIDHHLLDPAMTDEEIIRGAALAVEYDCASICVKPYFAGVAAKLLRNTGISAATVIGFPHGSSSTRTKLEEMRDALEAGVTRVEMVVNIGKVCSSEWGYVQNEIAAVNAEAVAGGAALGVIFENGLLTDARIEQLCLICNMVQTAFIATSTGFGLTGHGGERRLCENATIEHLALMRRAALPSVAVKATGGIDTLDDLFSARKLGVSRVGTTSTEAVLEEAIRRFEAGSLQF